MGQGMSEQMAAPKGAVARLAAVIGIIFGAVASLMLVVVLAITAFNVAGRYLFSAPIRGAEEATGFLVVAIVMFGVAETYRRGDHIRIDILTEMCSRRMVWWLDLLAHGVVLTFGVVLLRTALHTISFSRMFGAYSPGYLQIPTWIPQTALVVGGALLSLMALLRMIDHLLRARKGS